MSNTSKYPDIRAAIAPYRLRIESCVLAEGVPDRVTELSVHTVCGELRGPLPLDYPTELYRGQLHACGGRLKVYPRWSDGDGLAREVRQCELCLRQPAVNTEPGLFLDLCDVCLALNSILGRAWGTPPLFSRPPTKEGIDSSRSFAGLVTAALCGESLNAWRLAEFARLAAPFGPSADVPVGQWSAFHQAEPEASRRAFEGAFQLSLAKVFEAKDSLGGSVGNGDRQGGNEEND